MSCDIAITYAASAQSLCLLQWEVLFCQTSDLGLRLEVDFVFPLSQEEEEEQQQQPLTKIYQIELNKRSGIWHTELY